MFKRFISQQRSHYYPPVPSVSFEFPLILCTRDYALKTSNADKKNAGVGKFRVKFNSCDKFHVLQLI